MDVKTRESDLFTMQITFGGFVPEEDLELDITEPDEYLAFFDEMLEIRVCPA